MAAANLFQQYLQPPRSVADYGSDLDKAEANQLALVAARRQNDLGAQDVADQNAIRRLYAAGVDPGTDAGRTQFMAAAPTKAGALLASQADLAHKGAQTKDLTSKAAKSDYEVQQLKHEKALREVASAPDAQGVQQALAAHVQAGNLNADEAQRIASMVPQDPARHSAFQIALLNGMLSAKDAMDAKKLAFQTNNTGGAVVTSGRNPITGEVVSTQSTPTTQSPDNRATVGATLRGQNMTDARARESTSAMMTKPFEVTGPDGQPMLVQQDKHGNIAPVQGFGPKAGSSKPLTDTQAKALGFGTRMQESDKLLNQLAAEGVNTPSLIKQTVESVPGIGGALGSLANMTAASPKQQQVEQAQRDFVNAVLRRESGAAISESEFQNARKQYFNQPGDSSEVKAQKAANRKLAAEGVMAEVPRGQRGSIGPQGDIHAQADAILKGK